MSKKKVKPGETAPNSGNYQNTQRPSHHIDIKFGKTMQSSPKPGQMYIKKGK
ncbi:MAG: hypothetical protein ACRC9L_08610 [Brevinema sp.]